MVGGTRFGNVARKSTLAKVCDVNGDYCQGMLHKRNGLEFFFIIYIVHHIYIVRDSEPLKYKFIVQRTSSMN